MKELFFTIIALSIPLLLLGAVVYLFLRGLYSIYADWRLGHELEELSREAEARRRERVDLWTSSSAPIREALEREAQPVESKGILVMPIDAPIRGNQPGE